LYVLLPQRVHSFIDLDITDTQIAIADELTDVPSPPPPVGQPLLDPEQQIFFDQFFDDMPHDMIPSVNPAHIFDPEMPKDAAIWPDMIPRDFQSSIHHLAPDSLSITNTNGYYGNHVSSAPAMNTSHLDLNPFSSNHELIQPRNRQDNPMSTAPSLLNFGTDTNFAPNGYNPPPLSIPLDKDAEVRSKVYSALTRNDSVLTTAVNSPAEIKDEPEDYAVEDSTPGLGEDESASPQTGSCMKRRAEEANDFTPSKSARKTRPRNPESAQKTKKSQTQKRDNLTEAQKRENHIHSEQKRRNLIRQGFDELCALVPELKAGGYSKSAVLIHAANYLDDLKKGNARLKIYLQQLEGARQF